MDATRTLALILSGLRAAEGADVDEHTCDGLRLLAEYLESGGRAPDVSKAIADYEAAE